MTRPSRLPCQRLTKRETRPRVAAVARLIRGTGVDSSPGRHLGLSPTAVRPALGADPPLAGCWGAGTGYRHLRGRLPTAATASPSARPYPHAAAVAHPHARIGCAVAGA